jgi:hypothetical protein
MGIWTQSSYIVADLHGLQAIPTFWATTKSGNLPLIL